MFLHCPLRALRTKRSFWMTGSEWQEEVCLLGRRMCLSNEHPLSPNSWNWPGLAAQNNKECLHIEAFYRSVYDCASCTKCTLRKGIQLMVQCITYWMYAFPWRLFLTAIFFTPLTTRRRYVVYHTWQSHLWSWPQSAFLMAYPREAGVSLFLWNGIKRGDSLSLWSSVLQIAKTMNHSKG